jgi:MFS family permease
VFFILGLVGSSWVSRIPALSSALNLSSGSLGLALLGLPLGSIVASLSMPRLVHRFGGWRPALALVPLAGLTLVPPALAGGVPSLFAALIGLGATTGGVDVAMNAHGVLLERLAGRSLFGRLHAMWSLGAFTGAGLGALLAAAGVSPVVHFALVGGAAVVAAALLGRAPTMPVHATPGPDVVLQSATAPDSAPSTPAGRSGWSRDRRVVALSLIALAGFIVEVVAADWGGVFLRRDLAAGAGVAAGTYAAFALPHFLVRALGDPLVDRLDRRWLLGGGLGVALVGYCLVVASEAVPVALAGLALAGVGVALVVPVAFANAGRIPGVTGGAGIATAAGFGYVGWAAAPPVIGGLATVMGLRAALAAPAVIAAVGIVVVVIGVRRQPPAGRPV